MKILGASPNSEHDKSHACKITQTTFCLESLVASIYRRYDWRITCCPWPSKCPCRSSKKRSGMVASRSRSDWRRQNAGHMIVAIRIWWVTLSCLPTLVFHLPPPELERRSLLTHASCAERGPHAERSSSFPGAIQLV